MSVPMGIATMASFAVVGVFGVWQVEIWMKKKREKKERRKREENHWKAYKKYSLGIQKAIQKDFDKKLKEAKKQDNLEEYQKLLDFQERFKKLDEQEAEILERMSKRHGYEL
jgi:hypothetical protein